MTTHQASPNATRPTLIASAGASDCHIHIYGPGDRYPLARTSPYPPPLATVAQYREVKQRLGIERVVIVQPAAYGIDNRCTMDAVAELGSGARAVVVVTPETTRSEIKRLHEAGARAARFFMLRGTVLRWDMLEPIAALIADFGWNVQLQFDGRELLQYEERIRKLPCDVVIDHNGKFLEPVTPDHSALAALLRLLDTGHVWVKASAPYETSRIGPPAYSDVGAIAQLLISSAPDRIVWATNWPHGAQRNKPDDAALLDLLLTWAPKEEVRQKILVANPAKLYFS